MSNITTYIVGMATPPRHVRSTSEYLAIALIIFEVGGIMSGLIRPKIELDQAFMPVLVTSNFDDDSIKNERASMETPFSHYKSMGNFLDAQGQLTQ